MNRVKHCVYGVIISLTTLFCYGAGEVLCIDFPTESSVITGENIVFHGRASAPFAIIRLCLNATIIAVVSSLADGNWSYTYSPELEPGSYVIRAQIVDNQFNLLADCSHSFIAE